MSPVPVTEILLGIYLGLLAAIFPSFIAFAIGFGFKYFTDVTVPGLGVVVLGGALAGVSGGLMGLMDPSLTQNWTGPTAVLVILMGCLWAHSQGDKLGAATPRRLTLKTLRDVKLSTDIVNRVDSYGQVRIRPIGVVQDIEGYPPLPDDIREQLATGSWKFPSNLPLAELESRLEERLATDHQLADVTASIDSRGRAQIAAAPSPAGLSRRVPAGTRAVSIATLLPSNLARGDVVTVKLPSGDVSGPVVSARTGGGEPVTAVPATPAETETTEESATETPGTAPAATKAPTTTGGEGRVTIAVALEEARRILRAEFAPVVVHSRGTQREYEAIGVLKQHGNRFRKVTLPENSPLVGRTIGTTRVHDTYDVAILAIKRHTERIIAPRGATELRAGDRLIVVGKPEDLQRFEGGVR